MVTLCAAALGILVLVSPAPALASESEKIWGTRLGYEGTVSEISSLAGGATVSGAVVGDVSSVLGPVCIGRPVGGSVRSGFGSVETAAPVGGDIEVGFGDVYVNSLVEGDVDVGRGKVHLGPDALVLGHVSIGDGAVSRQTGSVVDGTTMYGAGSAFSHTRWTPRAFSFAGWLLATVGLAACSVLTAALAPVPLSAVARKARQSPVLSLLSGVASGLVAFVLSTVLAISVVGIPILILLAAAYRWFVDQGQEPCSNTGGGVTK